MCLAIPAKVTHIDESKGFGLVDVLGVSREAVFTTLDEDIKIGDFVLLHAGFAIRKVNTTEALKSIEMHQKAAKNI